MASDLSFATFFWGTLQLTNGPFRIQYNMQRATFVTVIYVEMAGRKKPGSWSVLKRPHESQWMVALSVTEKKPSRKKSTLFPRRAKSCSFATLRRSLRGRGRACFLLFRRRKSTFQSDYHLPLTLPLSGNTGKRQRGGPLSVTVRNYKGKSAFKD